MKVATKDLHRVLHNALLFVSRDEFRGTMTGVRLRVETHTSRLTATGTDSYRLAEDSCNAIGVQRGLEEGLVRGRDATTLSRLCRETRCKEVRVLFGHEVISFRFDMSTHSFKKMAGTYPDTEKLWPKKFADTLPSVALNPQYLAAFGKIKPHWEKSPLVFRSSGANKQILVEFSGPDESFRGLLMPVRVA